LQEGSLAAIHIHHVAHAAFTFAEVQRHTGKGAACQDQQKK
jgi:hypothetical protein